MGIADSPSDIEESKHTHGTDQRQGIYTYGEVLELRLPPDRRLLPYGLRQARDDPGVVERRRPRGALHTRRTARKPRTRRASRAAAAGALWPHRRRRGKRWSGQRRHVVASLRAVASLRGMLLAVRALPRVAGDALAARMRAPCIGSSLHVMPPGDHLPPSLPSLDTRNSLAGITWPRTTAHKPAWPWPGRRPQRS